jgi:hypothetical protein
VENGENLLMDFSPFSILCDCAAESFDTLAYLFLRTQIYQRLKLVVLPAKEKPKSRVSREPQLDRKLNFPSLSIFLSP